MALFAHDGPEGLAAGLVELTAPIPANGLPPKDRGAEADEGAAPAELPLGDPRAQDGPLLLPAAGDAFTDDTVAPALAPAEGEAFTPPVRAAPAFQAGTGADGFDAGDAAAVASAGVVASVWTAETSADAAASKTAVELEEPQVALLLVGCSTIAAAEAAVPTAIALVVELADASASTCAAAAAI